MQALGMQVQGVDVMATSLAHLQHLIGSQASWAKSGAFQRAPQQ